MSGEDGGDISPPSGEDGGEDIVNHLLQILPGANKSALFVWIFK